MKNEKPKCSCYGGFDCPTCNPAYYNEQKTTDTPRTDAVFSEPCAPHQVIQKWEKIIEHSRQLERELTEAKAEVKNCKKLAIELVQELISKCDDPIHLEQLASLSSTSSL